MVFVVVVVGVVALSFFALLSFVSALIFLFVFVVFCFLLLWVFVVCASSKSLCWFHRIIESFRCMHNNADTVYFTYPVYTVEVY